MGDNVSPYLETDVQTGNIVPPYLYDIGRILSLQDHGALELEALGKEFAEDFNLESRTFTLVDPTIESAYFPPQGAQLRNTSPRRLTGAYTAAMIFPIDKLLQIAANDLSDEGLEAAGYFADEFFGLGQDYPESIRIVYFESRNPQGMVDEGGLNTVHLAMGFKRIRNFDKWYSKLPELYSQFERRYGPENAQEHFIFSVMSKLDRYKKLQGNR